MGIGSIDSAQMALLGISRMNVAGVSSRSERWCRESSDRTNGRPVLARTTSCVELKREAAEVMIGQSVTQYAENRVLRCLVPDLGDGAGPVRPPGPTRLITVERRGPVGRADAPQPSTAISATLHSDLQEHANGITRH